MSEEEKYGTIQETDETTDTESTLSSEEVSFEVYIDEERQEVEDKKTKAHYSAYEIQRMEDEDSDEEGN